MVETVELENGKYIVESNDGVLNFKRNGEDWPAANADLKFSKVVGAMFNRIIELDKIDAPVKMSPGDGFGKTIELMWQGKCDGMIQGFEINGMLCIPSRDGVTYIRREDVKAFFGI
jgi:hypothetical protein